MGEIESLTYYNRAIQLAPNVAQFYLYRYYALQKFGDTEGALRDAEKYVEMRPDNDHVAWLQRIREERNAKLAKTSSQKAPESDAKPKPQETSPVTNSNSQAIPSLNERLRNVRSVLKEKKYNEALKMTEEIFKTKPDSPLTHKLCADSYYGLGQIETSLIHYNRAIQLDSTKAEFYVGRHYALEKMGDIEGALKDAEKCTELCPNQTNNEWLQEIRERTNATLATRCHNKACNLAKENRPEEAFLEANKAIQFDPKLGRYTRALVYAYHGLISEALEDINFILKQDPANKDANQLLATIKNFQDENHAQQVAREEKMRRDQKKRNTLMLNHQHQIITNSINSSVAAIRQQNHAFFKQASANAQSVLKNCNSLIQTPAQASREMQINSQQRFEREREATARNFTALKQQESKSPGSVGSFSSSTTSSTNNNSNPNINLSCATQIPHPMGGFCPPNTKPVSDPPGSCGFRLECPPNITFRKG